MLALQRVSKSVGRETFSAGRPEASFQEANPTMKLVVLCLMMCLAICCRVTSSGWNMPIPRDQAQVQRAMLDVEKYKGLTTTRDEDLDDVRVVSIHPQNEVFEVRVRNMDGPDVDEEYTL